LRDIFGGAERVAWNLAHGARDHGMESWLAVHTRVSGDTHVLRIPKPIETYGPWGRFWSRTHSQLRGSRRRGAYRLATAARWLGEPVRSWQRWRGIEDFRFPGSRNVLQLPPCRPDIVHCHNLHGGYFDLSFLPRLSASIPVVITLHDAWLLSGHCSHSMNCDRWKTGCGRCPDLTLYPAIQREASAYNWRRKQRIYQKSKLHIATPCQWLMDRVMQSMLAPAIVERRVIPNGVDLDVFKPGEQMSVRNELGLPINAKVLLFAANQWITGSRAKDYATLRDALRRLSERPSAIPIVFVALGESADAERVGSVEIRFIPFQNDQSVVARYYQAADLYVHSAHVDTFPTTVLEALACGTPVIATGICGIPEQVNGLKDAGIAFHLNRHGSNAATGILVPPGDAEAMASAVLYLLDHESLRALLSNNARRDAETRFDLHAQIRTYCQWYADIVHRARDGSSGREDTSNGECLAVSR
jgi:glycosyltransferase involved in cell wall biosynthesis